jgi:hypothetical protein
MNRSLVERFGVLSFVVMSYFLVESWSSMLGNWIVCFYNTLLLFTGIWILVVEPILNVVNRVKRVKERYRLIVLSIKATADFEEDVLPYYSWLKDDLLFILEHTVDLSVYFQAIYTSESDLRLHRFEFELYQYNSALHGNSRYYKQLKVLARILWLQVILPIRNDMYSGQNMYFKAQ